MKCPICGEKCLREDGYLVSHGWVPKDEFDKKGLRRISYQEWHSIGNSSILLGQRYQTLFYAKNTIKSLACLMFAKHFLIMRVVNIHIGRSTVL